MPRLSSEAMRCQYGQKALIVSIQLFRVDDFITGTTLTYSFYPKGLTAESVVEEILFSVNLNEDLALQALGFNSSMMSDLLFSICVLVILLPTHPLSKIINKYRIKEQISPEIQMELTVVNRFKVYKPVMAVDISDEDSIIADSYASLYKRTSDYH